MHRAQPRKFCIVGLGGHARTKIVPALAANGQELVGVVTGKASSPVESARQFRRLEDALAMLPRDTVFYVATPPHLHAAQAITIAAAGFDQFIEKPAFVMASDAAAAIGSAREREALLVEAFMYRHTRSYERFLDYWSKETGKIREIAVAFTIPAMPEATFRSLPDVAASSLFDIGCYPISLLSDLGAGSAALTIVGVAHAGEPERELVRIAGATGGLRIRVEIGVAGQYRNEVRLSLTDGATVAFSPFFYGRPGERRIVVDDGPPQTVSDGNAFETMLALPRSFWLEGQDARWRRMIEQAGTLERLGRQLGEIRGGHPVAVCGEGSIG